VSHGQNVTVDVLIGSKCHSGRSELGRNVQAAFISSFDYALSFENPWISYSKKTINCQGHIRTQVSYSWSMDPYVGQI
jgi:hypothetical protein